MRTLLRSTTTAPGEIAPARPDMLQPPRDERRASSETPLLSDSKSPTSRRLFDLSNSILRYTVQESAAGVIAAEYWVMDDSSVSDGPKLRRPHGAWFLDAAFEAPPDGAEACAARFRSGAEDDAAATPCAVGVGLVGILYSAIGAGGVDWRDLAQMDEDPDLPTDEHVSNAKSWCGFVAGVGFDDGTGSGGSKGLMILYARATADLKSFQTEANANYLRACAGLCGSLATASRAARVLQRSKSQSSAHRKLSLLRTLTKAGWIGAAQLSNKKDDESGVASLWAWCQGELLAERARLYVRKFYGVGATPLAPSSWYQAGFSFVGALLTSIAILAVNGAMMRLSGDPISLGSLGAMMTMHFAAFNSPLAQPRNVLGGNIIAASIAFIYLRLPEFADYLHVGHLVRPWPYWLAAALAPATAIALMQKLGFTHPPAGAIALYVVTTQGLTWRWIFFPLVAGNSLCIFAAMTFNNLSTYRQYPIYW